MCGVRCGHRQCGSALVVGEMLGLGSPDCVRARARVHFQACVSVG